jgi:photosystem II stability/assembly factor-like uncharacterized protein
MGIKIMNYEASLGHEKMIIKTSDPSGGHLRLFPGTNQVVLASVNDGSGYKSYRSTDSGSTFEQLPDSFPVMIFSATKNLTVSFNNRYYYAGDPSIVDGDYYFVVSNNFGSTFTYDPSATNEVGSQRFTQVASSRDGKYAIGCCGGYTVDGEALLTQDFGQTWQRPLSTDQWYKCFIDPTGENMLIGGNGFSNPSLITQYSDDFGDTWSNFSESLTSLGNAMISGDGNYKVVWEQYEQSGQGARVYVSTDWTNWTQNNLTKRFSGGAISNDGKYMLLPPSDGYTTGGTGINLSTDYGQNWTEKTLPGVSTERKYAGSAMSSDGKYMIVVSGFNDSSPVGAYKSIDYGNTWTQIDTGYVPAANYNTVKMSKSGRYVYITGADGLFYSQDYMATWMQQFDGSTGGGVFINF